MPSLVQAEQQLIRDNMRNSDDWNDIFRSDQFDDWLRTEIFSVDFIAGMDEKWPAPDMPMWDRIADWMHSIMQTDPLEQGSKMKFFTARNLFEFAAFWDDMFHNKKQHFYWAMHCNSNGNPLAEEDDRPLLEEAYLRTVFRSPFDIASENSEVTLENFKFDIQVSWVLDIFQDPPNNHIFPNEQFQVFWRLDLNPVNRTYHQIQYAESDADSAFEFDDDQ